MIIRKRVFFVLIGVLCLVSELGAVDEIAAKAPLPGRKGRPGASGRVAVRKDYLDIMFLDDVRVRVLKDDEEFVGISNVTMGKLPFRNPDLPIKIEISAGSDDKVKYRNWKYKGYDLVEEKVVVHTGLLDEDGNEDSLDVVFEPRRFQVDDHTYKGFGYHYKFMSTRRTVYKLSETSTWELGGSSDGNTLIYQPYIYHELNQDEGFEKNLFAERFVHQPFDYQMNEKGSLVSYYETLAMINTVFSKPPASSAVNYTDTVFFGSAGEFETPVKCVLFDSHRGIDEWTLVRDSLYKAYQARYGLKETEPMPMVHWESFSKSGGFGPLNPQDFATVLPRLRELGIRHFLGEPFRVSRASLMGSGSDNDQPWMEGGEEGMKYAAEKGRENGITFFVWTPSNHLSTPETAPNSVLNQHPEWMTRTASGETTHWHFSPSLRVCSFKTGFKDFYLQQLRSFHEKTGLSGLWLDSNRMLWVPELFNYGVANPGPELEEYLSVLRGLQETGFSTMFEMGGGSSPFGLASGVYYLERLLGREFLAYKTVPEQEIHLSLKRRDAQFIVEENLYYRLLANKCCWMLYSAEILDPRITGIIARANWDYNRVFQWMKRRHVLEEGRGIEWEDRARSVKVLFSFETFGYPVASGMRVADITDGKEIRASGGSLLVQPIHTYWIGRKLPKGLFDLYRLNEPFTVQASLEPLAGKLIIRLALNSNTSSEMKVSVKVLVPEQANWEFSKESDDVILPARGKEERVYELVEPRILPQDLPLDLVIKTDSYEQDLTMWMFKQHLDPVMMNKPVPYDSDDEGKQVFDPPGDFRFIFVPRYLGKPR